MTAYEEWQTTGTFNGEPFHTIHHSEDGARNYAETSRLVGTWNDGPHFHKRIVTEWQAVHDSAARSHLGDLIIEVGPFVPGEELGGFGMALQRGADLNDLRNELIALRRIANSITEEENA